MFSIRVQRADRVGHQMYECREYEVVPGEGSGQVIRMKDADGVREISLTDGIAFVMGDSGKTVEIVRPRVVQAQLKGAR